MRRQGTFVLAVASVAIFCFMEDELGVYLSITRVVYVGTAWLLLEPLSSDLKSGKTTR